MSNTRKKQTEVLVLGAILTALVIVLQLMGSFIRFGAFSISLVLIPIVIGAATCGTAISAWLGFIFGVVVLLSGDATLFMGFNVPGTIITVLLKGTACGLAAGAVYKLFEKFNQYVSVLVSAIVCPIVNTAVFTLGCYTFFMNDIVKLASEKGFDNATQCIFILFIGGNFFFEIAANIILSPVIIRILNIRKKETK